MYPDGNMVAVEPDFDEAEEDEADELGHAETYAEYMPLKCKTRSLKCTLHHCSCNFVESHWKKTSQAFRQKRNQTNTC